MYIYLQQIFSFCATAESKNKIHVCSAWLWNVRKIKPVRKAFKLRFVVILCSLQCKEFEENFKEYRIVNMKKF